VFSSYRKIMARKAAGEMDETGFTLIELLIVIVVLGILAGVVIFALGGVTGQSAIAACKADGATVSTGLAAFNTDNPGLTLKVVQNDLLPVTATNTQPTTDAVVGGPFLQSWPASTHYAYTLSSTGGLQVALNVGGTLQATPQAYTGAVSCDGITG
jgi:general secretion pathway protein G